MKKQLLIPLFLFMGTTMTPAQKPSTHDTPIPRMLVAYFSATGTTAVAARQLAAATGADLFAITPGKPYTAADLDWHDSRSRSSLEMNDPQSRPALEGRCERMKEYDVVFIGYPIWWDLAPRIINTFIESHDLKGKTVIAFATSGGSGISHSVSMLKRDYPDLNWKEGRLLNRANDKSLRNWLASLGF